VSIPSVVVAETIRDTARDAPVNRVINAVGQVDPVDEGTGRIAGALLGATRATATIDALVVATAVAAGGAVILTGDPDDLRRLTARDDDVLIQPL